MRTQALDLVVGALVWPELHLLLQLPSPVISLPGTRVQFNSLAYMVQRPTDGSEQVFTLSELMASIEGAAIERFCAFGNSIEHGFLEGFLAHNTGFFRNNS